MESLFESVPLAASFGSRVGLRLRTLPPRWTVIDPPGTIPLHRREDGLSVMVSRNATVYAFAVTRERRYPSLDEVVAAKELFQIPRTVRVATHASPSGLCIVRLDIDPEDPVPSAERAHSALQQSFDALEQTRSAEATLDPEPLPQGWDRHVVDGVVIFRRTSDGLSVVATTQAANDTLEAAFIITRPRVAPSRTQVESVVQMFLRNRPPVRLRIEAPRKASGKRFIVTARCTIGTVMPHAVTDEVV